MRLEKKSPCKVNLILNILGKRADGFHELETVMQPVNICDEMIFERGGSGLHLTCSHPELPTDSKNLVHRAATSFLAAAKISDGVKIHLQKNLPLAGGIGGGSANAAATFSALNELFGNPLPPEKLHELAADALVDLRGMEEEDWQEYDSPDHLKRGSDRPFQLLKPWHWMLKHGVMSEDGKPRKLDQITLEPNSFVSAEELE